MIKYDSIESKKDQKYRKQSGMSQSLFSNLLVDLEHVNLILKMIIISSANKLSMMEIKPIQMKKEFLLIMEVMTIMNNIMNIQLL